MITDDYDVTRIFAFTHVTSEQNFAVVFRSSYRDEEPNLRKIRIFRLDTDRDRLRLGTLWEGRQPEPWMDMELSGVDCRDQISTVLGFKGEELRYSIMAALREGHIMGEPFFMLSIDIQKEERLASIVPDIDR